MVESALFHTSVSLLGAVVTIAIVYALYRSRGVMAWGWIASFLPDAPVFALQPLGASSLDGVMLVSHTLGILLYPVLLSLADILLIEAGWLKYLTWLPYPKYLHAYARIDRWVQRLEKYHALPHPARLKRVFMAALIAAVVHLGLNLAVGVL
ncbi:MAG: hypothetical protein HY520_01150 [Candidatus Aenigmarchaeota archaeon]|nr:hypothetical protein [Candidatus Aenigmarchaeota archaeon]